MGSAKRSWSMDDVPYGEIDADLTRKDRQLLYLVAAASFIEITSDTYTGNLIAYYAEDHEVVGWLADCWQREELRHGAALRRYVEHAWPDFDWEEAYASFIGEYSHFCSVDQLAATRALEMAARCVVETGTSSFYHMLSQGASEPVLRRLAAYISRDEVDHYKHFYRYFRAYAERENPSRASVLRTLIARIIEAGAEDGDCAFRHVFAAVNRPARPGKADYRDFHHRVRAMALRHYRYDQAVKMLLRPLALGREAMRFVIPSATAATRLLLFR